MRRIDGLNIFLIDSTVAGAAHRQTMNMSCRDRQHALMSTKNGGKRVGVPEPRGVCVRKRRSCGRRTERFVKPTKRRCIELATQTAFAGISASICLAGEQAVTLEFEPR